MLDLRGVVLRYPDFTLTADWHLPQGAEVAIIGPSGAGKSTLLAAIAGFEDLSAGAILWQGRDITRLRPGLRPMAMLFQDNNLFPHLTAFDNVALGLAPSGRLSAAGRAQVTAALAQVGLEGFATRRPAQLSGGQQGRVAIARVLVQQRPLILLDEPFAALGPALRREMLGLVRHIAQDIGATLLLVTHDATEARALPLTVLVSEGQAAAPMATDALFADPPPALRAWLGQ